MQLVHNPPEFDLTIGPCSLSINPENPQKVNHVAVHQAADATYSNCKQTTTNYPARPRSATAKSEARGEWGVEVLGCWGVADPLEFTHG